MNVLNNIDNSNLPYIAYGLALIAVIFQVLAWYTHTLLPDNYSLFSLIIISWLIALIEFIFLIPALHIANKNNMDMVLITVYKVAIFFVCFSLFNSYMLGNEFKIKHLCAYILMALSVYIVS